MEIPKKAKDKPPIQSRDVTAAYWHISEVM
jgi:hypothetical protein